MADPRPPAPPTSMTSASAARHRRRLGHPPRASDRHPARGRGPAAWTTKQITLVGLALSAVVTLLAALLPTIIDRGTASADNGTRDALDGTVHQVAEIDGLEAEVTSLSHLVVYVPMIDRDYFEPLPHEEVLPRWDVTAKVRVPDGRLSLSVPVPWASLAPPDDAPQGAVVLVGTQGVGAETYLAGGVAGVLLMSRPDDMSPGEAMATTDDWPGDNCIEQVPARQLYLDEGLAALQVLVRCEAGSRSDDTAWVQIAVDTGDRLEVIEVTITSLRDLDALTQMLASLHLTEAVSRERGGL